MVRPRPLVPTSSKFTLALPLRERLAGHVDSIRIRGARQHNLQSIDVDLPRGRLIVITGPSGCGKSSLAFHTLYAEGQRRFVESLSAYARQFLDQLEKPEVDSIEGLSPAIAIEQRSGGLNPRSTVATATEIHDYLRVLWAAAGVPHDPQSGERLERMTAADIIEQLTQLPDGTKLILLAPIPDEETRDPKRLLDDLQRNGFIRVRIDGEIHEIDELAQAWPDHAKCVEMVIDRLIVRESSAARLADSVEATLRHGGIEARAMIQEPDAETWREIHFQTSYRNPRTGFTIGEITPRHFSFNSHVGACEACEGLGTEQFCDPQLLLGDASKPILSGGIRGWWPEKSARARLFASETRAVLRMFDLPEDTTIDELPSAAWELIFQGGEIDTGWKSGPDKRAQVKPIEGLANEALRRYREAKTENIRRLLSRAIAHRRCSACHGHRLKPEWLAVRILGSDERWLGIHEFCHLSVTDAIAWLGGVDVHNPRQKIIAGIAAEISKRLSFLSEVGLDYLALDRASGSLSGGEAQRIRLASQLGAGLSGVIYVLDEPSIGLHATDTARLIGALKRLRDLGNTVVVVEHDEEIIRAADLVVDMGPGAGRMGGHILAMGAPDEIDSPTGHWLRQEKSLTHSTPRGLSINSGVLRIRMAREHNLQNLNVEIPLGSIVCLCGPSGSGKSTLADDILRRAMARHFHHSGENPGAHDGIDGLEQIHKLVIADQSPIGRSPRSNPATFSGAFDLIRSLFAMLPLAKQRGYSAARFSFNAKGGRCEACQGNGRLKIEMHFLPDAWVPCPACDGRRFNRETLEVTYKGHSIAEVLALDVDSALALFRSVPKLHHIFTTLHELGLGYLPLGQAANTLSGGEAQRLKLAVELARPPAKHTFYLFDEPTTGLHFGDVARLIDAFQRLRDAGHSILVIEHHLDVIAAADHVIELGPGGGKNGGQLVAAGSPSHIAQTPNSPSGIALKSHFSAQK